MCCGRSRCAPTSPHAARPQDCAPHTRPAAAATSSAGAAGDSAKQPGPSLLLLRPSPPLNGGAWKSLACHLPTIPGRLGAPSSAREPQGACPPSELPLVNTSPAGGGRVRTHRSYSGSAGGAEREAGVWCPVAPPGGVRAPGPRAPAGVPTPRCGRARLATLISPHVPPRPAPSCAWIRWGSSPESWAASREGSAGPGALGLPAGLGSGSPSAGLRASRSPRRECCCGEGAPCSPAETRPEVWKVAPRPPTSPDMNQTAGVSNSVRCPPGKGHKVGDSRRRGSGGTWRAG